MFETLFKHENHNELRDQMPEATNEILFNYDSTFVCEGRTSRTVVGDSNGDLSNLSQSNGAACPTLHFHMYYGE